MSHDPNAASEPDSGIFGLDDSAEAAGVVLIPVPFEATTSYGGGAARGPQAILQASHQIDLFDVETGRPYAAGIALLPEDPRVVALNRDAKAAAARVIAGTGGDADLQLVNSACEEVEAWLHTETTRWLDAGKLVGVVGGDHSVPLGAIRAIAQRHPGLGILHIDAHADLRTAYQGFTQSHASIMYNVLDRAPGLGGLVQVAIRDLCEAEMAIIERDPRVHTVFDPTLARARAQGRLQDELREAVDVLPDQVYVSFDIDGLDPKLCPNTGTPVPGGLDLSEVSMLLEQVVLAGKVIVGFDLNEVAPGADGDEWDGNVGARALYKLVGWALKSRAGDRSP